MSASLSEKFARFGISDITVCQSEDEAVREIKRIYERSAAELEGAFDRFARGETVRTPIDAFYPFIGIEVAAHELNLDGRKAYGALHDPGLYGTTLSRPSLFESYYRTQIGILRENHDVPVLVGKSTRPMPLPFVVEEMPPEVTSERASEMQHTFAMPDLSMTDDSIANGTWRAKPEVYRPLALFSAERVDYSLHRLHHYTGTAPEHFQRFVLLTNYQRYIDDFVDYATTEINQGSEYDQLVQPGNHVQYNPKFHGDRAETGELPKNLPQMPAYHLTRPDGRGVTMVNIGVGPSNARTLTDHVAVLRPHCWLILGHCAGLRRTQQLGDYVLAHGYVREDDVLDHELPLFVPVPPIAEVQVALQQAVANVTGLSGLDLKTRMRTGTVATTSNRNWELRYAELFERLNQSRAIAVDMESATIAANGFRFRVPYGTLLCVSDKPLHGELKLRGMANQFYRERINQHLRIGLETIRILRDQGPDSLHSRKLRSFDEPAFR
jgi:AMP nucleosidase